MTDTRQSSQKANASAAGFGVVILAGGQGTRMGLDKSQLVLGNQTFLERIIESAQQVTRHVVVVGAHGQVRPSRMNGLSQSSQHAVIWASDQQPDCGPMEGIRVGLKMLSDTCSSAFVTSCDVPLLRPELITHLKSMMQKVGDVDGVVPQRGDRVYGMTAVYRTRVHHYICQLIRERRLKVSLLAECFNCINVSIDSLKSVDPELDSVTNVNSVEDYLNLLKRMGQTCPVELFERLRARS